MVDKKKALGGIVGAKNVADDEKALAAFAGDESLAKPLVPQYVAKVTDGPMVEKLVAWARETATPLVPVSSAAPHYKGDTVPGVPEAVIVDLSGMKKVISVNSRYRMAVIEPGVTYGELLKALAKEGLSFSMPFMPRAGKSVFTSVMETEPRLNSLHQWNFLDPLRCMEVTWGDGNRMFTGEAGSGPLDLEKQQSQNKWQWEYFGPMMFDYYRMMTGSQGTMGIATWASVKCEMAPKAHEMYFVGAKHLEDLIDYAYKVIRLRFTDEFLLVNRQYIASAMGKTKEEIDAIKASLPPWMALVGICGREILPVEHVEAQRADLYDIAEEFALDMENGLGLLKGNKVLNAITSPCEGTYWKERYKGAFQDIFFTTTLDQAPAFLDVMDAEAAAAGYPLDDIGVYLQPQNMGTSYHMEFTLPYDKENVLEEKRMRAFFPVASEALSRAGAYFMRPYGIWSRLQLNRDAAGYKALCEFKNIFDPAGILNPGKLVNY